MATGNLDPRLANPTLLALAGMNVRHRKQHPHPPPDEQAIRACRPWSVWIGGVELRVVYEDPLPPRTPEG